MPEPWSNNTASHFHSRDPRRKEVSWVWKEMPGYGARARQLSQLCYQLECCTDWLVSVQEPVWFSAARLTSGQVF